MPTTLETGTSEWGNMTPPRRCPFSSGFTILELLVALAIALVILGAGAGIAFAPLSVEKKLLKLATDIEATARRTSLKASSYRIDHFLYIHDDRVSGSEGLDLPVGEGTIRIQKPSHGQQGWSRPPRNGYPWRFHGNGITEPLNLKITITGGEVILSFDPLTGEARHRNLTVYES